MEMEIFDMEMETLQLTCLIWTADRIFINPSTSGTDSNIPTYTSNSDCSDNSNSDYSFNSELILTPNKL